MEASLNASIWLLLLILTTIFCFFTGKFFTDNKKVEKGQQQLCFQGHWQRTRRSRRNSFWKQRNATKKEDSHQQEEKGWILCSVSLYTSGSIPGPFQGCFAMFLISIQTTLNSSCVTGWKSYSILWYRYIRFPSQNTVISLSVLRRKNTRKKHRNSWGTHCFIRSLTRTNLLGPSWPTVYRDEESYLLLGCLERVSRGLIV